MTLEQKVEVIVGYDTLPKTYRHCVPGTMRHVDEIMNERRTNLEPYNNSSFVYTADGIIFFQSNNGKDITSNGRPHLAITRESTNPVLKNIDRAWAIAWAHVHDSGCEYNYPIPHEDFATAINASDTVIIDLTKLSKPEYLHIFTTKYDKLNSEERKLTERLYGQGQDFVENMKMLEDAEIASTRIELPVRESLDYAVGLLSTLWNFKLHSRVRLTGLINARQYEYPIYGVKNDIINRETILPNNQILTNEEQEIPAHILRERRKKERIRQSLQLPTPTTNFPTRYDRGPLSDEELRWQIKIWAHLDGVEDW